MKWISIKDSLPDKNGYYLISHSWPGFGGESIHKVMNFQAIAYETPVNRWYDASVAPYITHWMQIEPPEVNNEKN